MGGCYTGPEDNKPTEPTVGDPTIGPQFNKQGENPVELWLKGEWIVKSTDTRNKIVYKYSKDLGKQMLIYDELGNLSSCSSYEIREDYFTYPEGTTHLLVYYTSEDVPTWENQLMYMEIEKTKEDQYKTYGRGYDFSTAKEEDWMANPKATYRLDTAVYHEKVK